MTDFITVAADVAGGWNGITSDMLLGVLDEIKSVLPIVVPAAVGFLGFPDSLFMISLLLTLTLFRSLACIFYVGNRGAARQLLWLI